MLFSGVGTPRLLEAAADAAGRLDDIELKANALLQLGDIALRRSDHDAAGKRYEEPKRSTSASPMSLAGPTASGV